jgi:drug/metabolite transporter (DMT)-like permease
MQNQHQHRYAVLAMLTATLAFAVMDMAIKLLSEHYSSVQVVFLRAASSLPVVLLVAPFWGGYRQLKTQRLKAHILRAALSFVMLVLVVYAFRQLTLADAYAIFFAGPLFITALSQPLLGEQVGRHRWIAVVVGFIGVLVVANPQGEGTMSLGALAALIAALCYAAVAITMRKLSSTESSICISFYFLVFLGIGSGMAASFDWQSIQWQAHWAIIATVGVAGAVGMITLAMAFRSSQASAIAPFEYTALLWAVALDFLVWKTIPEQHLYLGGAIIIASGVYIIHREHRQNRLNKAAIQP